MKAGFRSSDALRVFSLIFLSGYLYNILQSQLASCLYKRAEIITSAFQVRISNSPSPGHSGKQLGGLQRAQEGRPGSSPRSMALSHVTHNLGVCQAKQESTGKGWDGGEIIFVKDIVHAQVDTILILQQGNQAPRDANSFAEVMHLRRSAHWFIPG